MIDKRVQMMDAGMVLFTSEKPFGTVLGGIKAEMSRYGVVRRANEISNGDVPDTTGECDLFVDWSTPFRWRAISCRLEDAGYAGRNDDGEEIRRYAASFKEGNRNRGVKVTLLIVFAVAVIVSGLLCPDGSAGIFTFAVSVALSAALLIFGLRPSVKAQRAVKNLMSIVSQAK